MLGRHLRVMNTMLVAVASEIAMNLEGSVDGNVKESHRKCLGGAWISPSFGAFWCLWVALAPGRRHLDNMLAAP